jgi:hypothetical protein
MNTTLNIESASRIPAALIVLRTQPWFGCVRALLHVIAGVFAMLSSFGAPALVIIMLVYMFTR